LKEGLIRDLRKGMIRRRGRYLAGQEALGTGSSSQGGFGNKGEKVQRQNLPNYQNWARSDLGRR